MVTNDKVFEYVGAFREIKRLKPFFEACDAEDELHFILSDVNHITLTTWNEWTEGNFMEPTVEDGFSYLEAIREVFGTQEKPLY